MYLFPLEAQHVFFNHVLGGKVEKALSWTEEGQYKGSACDGPDDSSSPGDNHMG